MLMTITTCRRPELLKRTLASLRENALDFESVTRAIICDDGSDAEQRAQMIETLNNDLESHNLDALGEGEEGGHAASMKRIWERVTKTDEDFIMMLEDDWELTRQGCPIFAAVDVLMNNDTIGQVCLGRSDIIFPGLFRTPTGTGYTIRPPHFGHENLPAFTLNPCVMRRDALRVVGNFKEGAGFEAAYGERWNEHWRTADLFEPWLRHIGQTSAYELQGRVR